MTADVRDAGLFDLPEPELRDVVRAVRLELRGPRENLHRLRRVRHCDTTVAVAPLRCVVDGECVCRDLVVDMLGEADRFLRRVSAEPLRNPPGAVRAHVRTRLPEWTRTRRVAMGAQARTDRLRGGALGRRLPDEYHRAVLEHLASEAGSIAPIGTDEALHRRLAELVGAEFDGTGFDGTGFDGSTEEHLDRVVAALPVVEPVCRSAKRVRAGHGSAELVTWWDRYIEEPMGRRERIDDVPLEVADLADRHPRPADDDDSTTLQVVLHVAARRGSNGEAALSAAVAELIARELLPATTAQRFLADPVRVLDAVAQVDLLLAG